MITKQQRKQVEEKIYTFMDIADKSKINSDFYKKLFSKLSDKDFENLFKKNFPIRFHYRPFESEKSKFSDFVKANDYLGVPTFESVKLPFKFIDQDGIPVESPECLVGFAPVYKMKQFLTKKNAMSTNIVERDLKTGLLTFDDKNSKTSDREIESLIINNLNFTSIELSRPRADAMRAKNQMYNEIKVKGQVSLADIDIEKDDSLAKNLANAYLISSHIETNLIYDDIISTKSTNRKVIKEI